MSTRSHIGIKNTDGTVDYIYCHFDGYPEHNGKILKEYYNTQDKVNDLMELGDLSSLGEDIGEKHDFDNRVRGWCHAYGRDRGETGVSVTKTTFDKLLADDNVDYLYIFDKDIWECYDTYYKNSINIYDQSDIEVNKK
jgi:hypothetical protein